MGDNNAKRESAASRPGVTCRNVTIYGYCKFQAQGTCAFYHPPPPPPPPASASAAAVVVSAASVSVSGPSAAVKIRKPDSSPAAAENEATLQTRSAGGFRLDSPAFKPNMSSTTTTTTTTTSTTNSTTDSTTPTTATTATTTTATTTPTATTPTATTASSLPQISSSSASLLVGLSSPSLEFKEFVPSSFTSHHHQQQQQQQLQFVGNNNAASNTLLGTIPRASTEDPNLIHYQFQQNLYHQADPTSADHGHFSLSASSASTLNQSFDHLSLQQPAASTATGHDTTTTTTAAAVDASGGLTDESLYYTIDQQQHHQQEHLIHHQQQLLEQHQHVGPLDPYYYQSTQVGDSTVSTSDQHQQQHHSLHSTPRQPLLYHLYNPPLPSVSNLHPHQKNIQSFFMADSLREELHRRNEAVVAGIDYTHEEYAKLPAQVNSYHSLCPLEPAQRVEKTSKLFGVHTTVYKAVSQTDGKTYILRRLEGYRLSNEAAMSIVEGWRRIRHANIVSVREAFTTKAFGDHSLVLVFDYHPLAETLQDVFLSPKAAARQQGHHNKNNQHYFHQHQQQQQHRQFQQHGIMNNNNNNNSNNATSGYYQEYHQNQQHQSLPLHQQVAIHQQQQQRYSTNNNQPQPALGGGIAVNEKTLWSFITQLASAIKTVHSAGLAIRVLGDASKIILTGKNRIRINCCGVLDILAFDVNKSISHWQQEDLFNFGQLLLLLTNGISPSSANQHPPLFNATKQLEMMARMYSSDVKNCILYLLSKPTGFKTIDDVVTMIGPRLLHEINSAHFYNDFLEDELSRELENSRLVRLLCKFGFINERPEFDMDPQWSETGDRYLIKLFRDHVFHQVDESNRPILDISHVLTALNKVDVGVDEKIMLMSRDEQSCLIVRYKDIRACVDAAFSDLCKAALGDNSHAVAGSGGVPGTSGGSSVNLRSYS